MQSPETFFVSVRDALDEHHLLTIEFLPESALEPPDLMRIRLGEGDWVELRQSDLHSARAAIDAACACSPAIGPR